MRKRLTLIALASAMALALMFIVLPETASAQAGMHVVQRGDTLSGIAARYGTTQAAIMQANGLSNANFVWVGQRLRIPGPGGATSSPAPAPAPSGYHIVGPGDNLSRIAARYGTTQGAIMQANGLSNANFVWVGQRLRIPGSGGATPSPAPAPAPSGYHTVVSGETLARIAARYGTTWTNLMRLNNLSNANHIYVGQRLRVSGSAPAPVTQPSAPARATGGSYTVQRGDGLAAIAVRHGVSLSALMRANGINNPDRIYVGQRLAIPGSGGTAARPAPAQPAPATGGGGKRIEINLTQQRLTAWEGDRIVLSTAISGGRARTPTVTGNFAINRKVQMQDMSGPGYYVRNVPWVMYFYGAYAIHGAYWHNNFGQPMSAGCVNMTPEEARWLYNWAEMGTPVRVTH